MILLFVIIWILCGLIAEFCNLMSDQIRIFYLLEEWIEPENIAFTLLLIIFGPFSLLIFAPKAIKIFIENLIERKQKNDK